jgi:hypothetical protein
VTFRLVVATHVAIAMALASASARAQSPAEKLERAVAAFNVGEFRRSLELLREVAPNLEGQGSLGRVYLYIGLNHAFLGEEARARRAFARALGYDPGLKVDPDRIKTDVVQLFEEVRRNMRGELTVEARFKGAVVVVDGVRRGRAPRTLRLPLGPHLVEVHDREGRVRHRQRVTVHADRAVAVVVSGRPRPKAETPVFEYRPERETAPAPPDEPPRRRRLWTWVAAGGTVAMATIGVGLWISGSQDYEEYLETKDLGRYHELEDSIPKKYIAADVFLGIAGAMAVTTVVLFFLEGRPAARKASAASIELRPLGSGGALSVRF